MNTEPTAEKIDEMARVMRQYADDLDRCAKKMRERGDLTYAAEAVNVVTNCFSNLRLDLMVVRPIREYEREDT